MKQKVHCAFFPLLLSCLYVCHSVISPSMSPLPVWFPTNYWLLLLDTISMDLRGWKTRLKETDREMMMRAACQGEIDLFFPPFFPRPCRPFSSHLCFLHMQAVVRSPEQNHLVFPVSAPAAVLSDHFSLASYQVSKVTTHKDYSERGDTSIFVTPFI